MQVPYLLNGFHPVVPFKEIVIEDDDSNDNGLINIDNLHLENNRIDETNV